MKAIRRCGAGGFRKPHLQRSGRGRLGGLLCNGSVVPFHVFAKRTDVEEVAGDMFELVAGKGHLKPCERKQHDKARTTAASRHA